MIRPTVIVALFSAGLASLVFACGDTVADPPSQFAPPPVEGPIDGGDPDGPVLIVGDGSTNQPPVDGSAEYACYTATSRAACRTCCHELPPKGVGRKVYTDAVDRCVCQPSKCGAKCATTLCAIPQTAPPANSECVACANAAAVEVGDASANPDASRDAASDAAPGNYPELGIKYCGSYANEACKTSEDCLRVERCKVISECSSKQ